MPLKNLTPDVRRPLRRSSSALALALLLFSAGCDDPSNVGQGLLGAQSSDTQVVSLPGATLDDADRGDLTGGNTAIGALRVLFGSVTDPVVGDMSATGYIDFVPAGQFDSAFITGTVSWAELRLNVDYQYGDTTSTVEVDLYDVPFAWQSTSLRSDSVIATSALVGSYTLPARSGAVTLELPSNWVSTHDATLRNSNFSDVFHGFALRPKGGNVVLGARFSESALRASAVPGDTVSFPMSKVGTLTEDDSAITPPGHRVLRDGGTRGLDMRLPVQDSAIGEALIHRVILKLKSDDWTGSYPAGFHHPAPGVIRVTAVSSDGATRLEIADVARNEAGEFLVGGTTLTNVIQSANLGKSVLDRFEISFPAEQSGIGFVSFPVDESNPGVETLITLTPLK